jgi:hypothetical protein
MSGSIANPEWLNRRGDTIVDDPAHVGAFLRRKTSHARMGRRQDLHVDAVLFDALDAQSTSKNSGMTGPALAPMLKIIFSPFSLVTILTSPSEASSLFR